MERTGITETGRAIAWIKDALREAQNDDVDATMVRTLNAQLRKEVGELKEEQTQAIKMLNSFAVELRKN